MPNLCVRHPIAWKPTVEIFAAMFIVSVALRQISGVKFTRDYNTIRELKGILCWLTWMNRNIQHRFKFLDRIHALLRTSLYYFVWLFLILLSHFFNFLLVCLNSRFIFWVTSACFFKWLVNKWNDATIIATLSTTVIQVIFVTYVTLFITLVILNLGLFCSYFFFTEHMVVLFLFTFHF